MSIRGVGDGYAFQRLLWLLVGLVVTPTVLISLFAVGAIRNQQAAILQELDRVHSERLDIAVRALASSVSEVESDLEGVRACSDLPCPVAVRGTSQAWAWRAGEAVPVELQAQGVSSEVGRQGVTVWVTPVDGSAPLAVVASGPVRTAWRLDPEFLRARLSALKGDRLPAQLELDLQPAGIGGSEALARSLGEQDLGIALQGPLAGWRLQLVDPDDGTRDALSQGSALSVVGLVSLLALVLLGAVLTLGSARREIRLSRLQTDFVSSVSHELRTPLTSIALFVDTLRSERLQDPERTRECLDLLALETDRLSRRIERVLDWARMEAGRRIYSFESVSAREICEEALRALRSQRLLNDEPDGVRLELTNALPPVRVDRDAIVEAMLNLLQNATKYTPPPRTITVRAAVVGPWVGLCVEDDGPGIERRHRRRIFEKFYQADPTLSSPAQGRVDRGSGLGLSIVRAVARAHGGRVELESEVGKGSRFTLWLPVAPSTG